LLDPFCDPAPLVLQKLRALELRMRLRRPCGEGNFRAVRAARTAMASPIPRLPPDMKIVLLQGSCPFLLSLALTVQDHMLG
jgi:hypothetical protein